MEFSFAELGELGKCKTFWRPAEATFGPGCFPIVLYAPAAAAVLLALLRPALRAIYPQWLRVFADEENSEKTWTVSPARVWTRPTFLVFALSLGSAVFAALASAAQSTPLFLIPLVPGLVSAGLVAATRPRSLPRTVMIINVILLYALLVASLALTGRPVLPTSRRSESMPPLLLWYTALVLQLTTVWTLSRMPLRDPFLDASTINPVFVTPDSRLRSPEDGFTLWNWMTFDWLAPIMATANRRQISEEDVWGLPISWQDTRLFLRLREMHGSLLWRVIRANARDIILVFVLSSVYACLSMFEITFLKQILSALEPATRDVRAAIAYSFLTFIFRVTEAQVSLFNLWHERRVFERVRAELIAALYEKALRRKAFIFSGEHGSEDAADAAAAAAVAAAPTSIPGGDDDPFEPASAGDIESPASPDETTPLISSGSSSGSTAASWSPAGGRWRPWLWRIGSAAAAAAAMAATGKPQARAQPPPPPPKKTEPFIPASAGMLFDLVKGDAYDVALRFWAFGLMTILLVRIIFALCLLVVILGPSAFLGIGVVLGSQLVVGIIARILTRVERRRRWLGDRKLQISVDFIQAIRHLRWYDWQEKWLGRILDARRLELRMLVVASLLKKAIHTVSAFSGFFFGVVAFYAYTVLAGHRLTADVAFPALGLFGALNDALEEMPVHIEKLLDSWVAVGRIESFMREPDKEEEDVVAAVDRGLASPPPPPTASPPGELRMAIRDGDFSWPGTRHRALHGVTVTFSAGLTVILGKVGAGKSALLNALLGEMDQGGGGGGGESQAQVQVPREMIGYCGQSPWLESLSIRDNILFCAPMDEVRYRQVLDACCLGPDLSAFPGGDMAHLGENGVGLSGGQRARVALARAVYSQSRILLLDDPIAALDHCTAETILARLFRGSLLLKGRIVVFATHRTALALPHADQVIEVHHGGVRAVPAEGVQELLLRLGRGRQAESAREDDDDDERGRGHGLRDGLGDGLGDGRGPDGATEDATKDGATGKIIIEEGRAHGSVLASVYWRYARYGSFWWWGMMLASMAGYRAMRIFYFYFLKSWSESYHDGAASFAPGSAGLAGLPIIFSSLAFFSVPDDGSSSSQPVFLDRVRNYWGLPDPADDVVPWTQAFALITMCMVLLMVAMLICTVVLTYISGKRLYTDILRSVSGAAFRFYDVTPVGRLINRLTSDLAAVDGPVPDQIQNLAFHLVSWIGSLAAISASTPAFLAIALATSAAFLHFFMRFFPTAQSLRRLEMAHLSPLFSNLGILIEGLVTVRAFKAEPHFQRRTFKTIDTFGNMDHFYWSCQNWLQYRYSLVSSGMTLVLSLYAVLGNLSQGTVGFVLSIAGGFISYTDSLCKAYGELQMQFVSVERLVELLDVEQEPEGDLDPAAAAGGRGGAADSWPSTEDDIVFDNVSVRYAPHLEPSLRGVTVRIPAGSSVAITGRTGSGKSTLALACLGTVLPDPELGGDIYIGGVSVTRANKHALRSRVSFVAQDPVLFAGSMRDNLDPQAERSDKECAAILGRILGHTAAPTDGDQQQQPWRPAAAAAPRITLRSRVEAGGRNLSQGQRQLVGLGRAILRRSAIVILDEATASIDARTATEMHEIMRTELASSTVITIAHRAEAVAGAEYVLEIAGGTVKEFRRVGGVE